MLKIKKISLFFIFVMSLITLVGCGIFGGKTEDYFENYDKINEEKDKVYDNFIEKITDNAQKSAFEVDYLVIGSADLVAAVYIAVVNMYNITPALVSQDIVKSKDTYTITDEESKIIVRYDSATKSTQLEMFENDVLEYVLETTELSNGGYAYQLYSVNGDQKLVYEFYFKDGNGSLAVKDNVTTRPESIYKKDSVPSTFAKSGSRVYQLDGGTYSFDGSLVNQKTMTGFSIYSGLNSEYLINETFNLTGMVLKVTYSDSTTENVNVTLAMLTSSMPDMTTTGQKSFKLTYNGVEKTFNFNVVSQLKTVTSFAIKSGLKTSYKVNDSFDAYNIILEVVYNDSSKEDKYVLSSMVVGSLPSTSTAGEKQLVLKIGTVEKTFTFNVTAEGLSLEDKLKNSYDDFFSTLYLGTGDSFVPTYMMNFMAQLDKPRNNFFNDFVDEALGQWSAVSLAQSAVTAIYLAQDNDFATLYPTPSNNFNKINYLNYQNGKHNLGLWIKVGLYSYWFEFVIEFNETADAFKMNVKSGVNENQVDRATFEYVGFDDGKYAMNLYYYDEGYDPADYCVYQLVFNNTTGRIAKNYLVNSLPASIYTQTSFTSFATTGDAVFNMTSKTSASYTKNIESEAFKLYSQVAYKLVDGEYVNNGSFEDLIFKKIENLDNEYEFDRSDFSLTNSYLSYAMEVYRQYEEKEFRSRYDDYDVVISKNGATTTLTLTNSYDEVEVIKVTFSTGKLKLEYTLYDSTYYLEVVKTGSDYYVQIIEDSDYNDYYILSKAKYTDANNSVLLYSDKEVSMPVSIYASIPTDFLNKGLLKFELKSGVLAIIKAFEVYVDPQNETEGYYMYTDFSGYLTLPTVYYTAHTFKGWYLNDVFIGNANARYKFSENSIIYAEFQ